MPKSSNSALPQFDNPPVIETALGVEFSGLNKWGIPHFGLFWNQIRDRFTKWEVKLPLDKHIEEFDNLDAGPQPPIQLSIEPNVRCWFLGKDNRTLVQIQKDRLVFNWRKKDASDQYPHYESSIRPAFEQIWTKFVEFVEQEQLGELNIIQCEVTYVNHMEFGIGWESFDELGRVFSTLTDQNQRVFLPSPETISFNSTYELPNKVGRLRVAVKPILRRDDGSKAFQQTLTARVKFAEKNKQSLMQNLDLGREWVVRGFADLTTQRMHEIWKRRI